MIGTVGHEYQWHQDRMEEREAIRANFEQLIRALITERGVNLIAEEAGNREEVLAQLHQDEANTPAELAVLFEGMEAVDEPADTIAKLVADELLGGNYVDIRSPEAERMTIEQRDDAMADAIMEALGSATSLLVICGEDHRAGLCTRLAGRGLTAESRRFPERQE